ncbi:hypothetical protein ECE50_012840 [Chitinophaga sp. Mgbs1]|uniref:Uncharacterized protein n=1 Tax=Chitinophaga solisilvae TaxID=1233460 RepID=A0A433WKU7_9BACT|nr:hypothetical protein [Chitinophaga solisilvae]
MTLAAFIASVKDPQPPSLDVYLTSLWYARKGNWDKAHELVQDLPDHVAAHIHAYLHRVEGDDWNADYWYRRAGEKRPFLSLEQEWEALAAHLLPREK